MRGLAAARPLPNFQAFTAKFNALAEQILTEVRVRPGFDPAAPPTPLPPEYKTIALWDTGASRSAISRAVAASLNLAPIGAVDVNHAGGTERRPTYLLNLELPNMVGVAAVVASEFTGVPGRFEVLIGMDIICLGDFTLTNVNGQTWVSFRMPSTTAVDYVTEHARLLKAAVGRNDPCPCGALQPDGRSRKFKHCHGRNT